MKYTMRGSLFEPAVFESEKEQHAAPTDQCCHYILYDIGPMPFLHLYCSFHFRAYALT